MKCIRVLLLAGMTIISSALLAQSKNEMPFTSSSPEAKKLLRQAWVAFGDAKVDEAGGYVLAALEKDPEFGLAHAFINTEDEKEREQNLKKASASQLSADEKILVDALLNAQSRRPFIAALVDDQRHKPAEDNFEPLLTKYPKDDYLHLWIMFNHTDVKRRAEIGEKMIKRNPKFAPAYNLLGYASMEQGDLKNAEAHFDKYVSLRPDLANTYDSKADYLMRIGKIEEAAALYQKAADMGLAASRGRADLAKAKLKYPAPSEQDREEIENIIKASFAEQVKGDVGGILKHYADQSMEIFPNQMVNAGIGSVRKRMEDTFGFGSFTRLETKVQSIEGAGPIAVAWTRTEGAFKPRATEKINEADGDDIFLLRKQEDGQWKILVHHWLIDNADVTGQPSNDSAAVRELINKWSFFMKPGDVLTQEHVENLVAIHSFQAIEIYPNQRSNIGIGNIRLRTEGFTGIKWAQFTGYSFDVNSFVTIGADGLSQRALAWGIGDQSHYQKGSDKLSQYLFPWAMILTKEKDGQWRILVYHFYIPGVIMPKTL